MVKDIPTSNYHSFSSAEKDQLIADLIKERDELRARLDIENPTFVSESQKSTDRHSLLAHLREYGTSKKIMNESIGLNSIKLGRPGLLTSRWTLFIGAALGLIFMLDYGIDKYQKRKIAELKQADLILENKVFSGLYSELIKVEIEPDMKSYRLTMALQSTDPRTPLYVMIEPTRVYEQAGLTWKEVPSQAVEQKSQGVIKLVGRQEFQTIFTPNIEDWAELMPGYMHIRFENEMLISLRAEPEEDIKVRKDRYFVYLKRSDANDEDIKQKMKYQTAPPLFIPMPPH